MSTTSTISYFEEEVDMVMEIMKRETSGRAQSSEGICFNNLDQVKG